MPGVDRQRGFTLLEMMLVLMLLAMSILLLTPQRQADSWRVTQESQRLAERLRKLSWLAVLEGRTYGLTIWPDRWQLKVWQERSWQDYPLPKGGDRQSLPPGWRLELVSDGQQSEQDTPQILLWPGGEVTPFRLRFLYADRTQAEIAQDEQGIHYVETLAQQP